MAIKSPSMPERDFIKLTTNHGLYIGKLRQLGFLEAAREVKRNAAYIGMCWLSLATEHLEDARASLQAGRRRSTLSRAYYAAYNASKAVRYVVVGSVSLAGDDHGKASELPDDFPSVGYWSATIVKLFENRLISDYDNWASSSADMSLKPDEAFELAERFVEKAREYFHARIGNLND
jgi:hypothetical protein